MFVVIYGRMSCPFCVQARMLAEKLEESGRIEGLRYIDMPGEGVTKDDIAKIAGTPVHTVPQVFVDEEHVGGFTEFQTFVSHHPALSA